MCVFANKIMCYIFKCTERSPKMDSSSSIVDIVWILNVYYTHLMFIILKSKQPEICV